MMARPQEGTVSEISLQAYEDEIDLLIEQARYVEALAHLRHLLTQFPHDVSAYYLLGKTMLEADLPDLAVDMFRRALSADSNHLLSRIGLGLAHERRNDLDAALWNLERALESDPSNGDVAEELRRMYGRREGVDLAYVPQTRAGLARLYLRASRYGRAADEFRALLEDQPARPDLMTALAEAYWRNGQWVQAAELCQEILDKLPYSLRANLLLGTLWVNSGQDEGWTYLRRAQEVDPGNHCAEELFGPDSLLTAQEVHVDRLVYEPDAIDVDQNSAWFKRLASVSVSVGISEAPPEMSADEVRLVDITAGLESQIEIPDWLRELGGDQEEESVGGLGWMADIEFETPDEAVADAPDVGRTVVEATEALDSAFGVEDASESEAPDVVPDWLQALAADELPVDLETPEGAPDWLRELVDERVSGEDSEPIILDAAAVEDLKAWAESETEAADWLSGLESAVSEIAEAGEEGDEDLLAWMHDEFPDVAGADEAVAEVETPPADAEEMPDWLAELEAPTRAAVEEAQVEVEPELVEADEVPEWLAALAPDVVAEVADEETADEVDLEEMPDWLAELEAPTQAGVEEAEVEVEPELAEADEVPEWLADLTPGTAEAVGDVGEDEAGLTGEDAMAWLERLAADYGEEGYAPAEEPAQAVGDLEVVEPLDVVDEVSADLEAEEAAGELLSGDDALAWLESLTAGKEEELRAEAEQASAARVAEILGRKRDVPIVETETVTEVVEIEAETEEAPQPEGVLVDQGEGVTEPAVPELEDEVPLDVVEMLQEEAEETSRDQETDAVEVVEPPSDEGEMLSGDDALAWLESLTVGKEEELRAEAEQASADRVAEILGRPRPAATVETAAVEAGAEVEDEMTPEPEISLEDRAEAAAEPTVPELQDEAIPDVVEHEELEMPAPGEPPIDEMEAVAAEDALSWLENLSPDEAAELREQVDGGDAATVIETPTEGERFFGWSAFDGGPEEVAPQRDMPVPEVAAEVSEPEEVVGQEPAATVEVSETAGAPETTEAPEMTEVAETSEADQMAEEQPAAGPEPATEPELDQEAPPELRPEATPSEATASDLDALRAHVKQKRSDHSARLRLGRELWEVGEIQESMQNYARLIKSSAKTDDVMADLQRYAEEKPNVPAVLRTLGDAYMKFGELDKALEIFNRAMDQL